MHTYMLSSAVRLNINVYQLALLYVNACGWNANSMAMLLTRFSILTCSFPKCPQQAREVIETFHNTGN